jgi:hypothetical protein
MFDCFNLDDAVGMTPDSLFCNHEPFVSSLPFLESAVVPEARLTDSTGRMCLLFLP